MTRCWSGGRREQWSRIENRAFESHQSIVSKEDLQFMYHAVSLTDLRLDHDTKGSNCGLDTNGSRTELPRQMQGTILSHAGQ